MEFLFDGKLYNKDTMPNGQSNQCRVFTRKGKGPQCKNPVFHSQIGHESWEMVGYVEGYPAYKPMVGISKEENEIMLAGVCYIHSQFDNFSK